MTRRTNLSSALGAPLIVTAVGKGETMAKRRVAVSIFAIVLLAGLLPSSAAAAPTDRAAASGAASLAAPGHKVQLVQKSKPRLIKPKKATATPSSGSPSLRRGTSVDTQSSGGGDSAVQLSANRALDQLGAPLVQWNAMSGSNLNYTTGDDGPNHFVHAINSRVTVYNKQGGVVAGPQNLGQFWNDNDGTVDACEGNAGDPVILYDNLADRWVITQFSRFAPFTTQVCLAVSVTSNPDWTTNGY